MLLGTGGFSRDSFPWFASSSQGMEVRNKPTIRTARQRPVWIRSRAFAVRRARTFAEGMKQDSLRRGRKSSPGRGSLGGTRDGNSDVNALFSIPIAHPISFLIIFFPAFASIVAASVIHRFQFFYILVPGFWCFAVASSCLHDVYSGKMCFRGLGNSQAISRSKAPIQFWGTIGIWALFYLFAAAFPIGYALQERAKQSREQGVAPNHSLAPTLKSTSSVRNSEG